MSKVEGEENLSERLEVICGLKISLQDRIFMSLVCMGMIPAWEVVFRKGEMGVDEFDSKLIDGGFETRRLERDWHFVNGPEKRVEICYSNSIEMVDRLFALQQANTGLGQTSSVEAQYGELYGFPRTAVEAYARDKQSVFSRRTLPLEVQNQDYVFLAQFALSRDHWKEELETPKKWAEALAKHVPYLWQEFVAEQRDLKVRNYGDR